MVDVERELQWMATAVPGARFTVFRLTGSREALEQRVRGREIGSGAEAQLARTLRYVEEIADPEDIVQIDTTELDVTTVARRIRERLAW
jgi:ribose 1,5-bisphosphokinase PhnN